MGAPKMPKPPPAPPPVASHLDPSLQVARDRMRAKRRGRQGVQSTLLTGPLGVDNKRGVMSPKALRPAAAAAASNQAVKAPTALRGK